MLKVISALAKKYSTAISVNGGNIGWISIDQLPPDMGSLFLTSDINTLIGPKVFDNVIILYKLTNIREVPLFKNTMAKSILTKIYQQQQIPEPYCQVQFLMDLTPI